MVGWTHEAKFHFARAFFFKAAIASFGLCARKVRELLRYLIASLFALFGELLRSHELRLKSSANLFHSRLGARLLGGESRERKPRAASRARRPRAARHRALAVRAGTGSRTGSI